MNFLIFRGYPIEHLAVETVVLSGLGESGRNKLRADVIVYDQPVASVRFMSREIRLAHALIVAEIKRESKGKDSGLQFQLEPAMRLLPAMSVLGVYWDDVNRILLHKKLHTRSGATSVEVLRDSLANLPPFGQLYRSKPLSLDSLLPAENLVATLFGIANVMRSHGINDEQLRYKETVKLLLARYIDEREAKNRAGHELHLQVHEGADPTFQNRVAAIYEIAAIRYSRATSLFRPQAQSELSDATLRDCVRAIQGVNLSSASNDVMQQVFMSFVPSVFKKSLDQYFTPTTLIDAMVEMTGIGPTDKVADPAMGTADFLTSAMAIRITAGDDDVFQRIFGADKDEKAFDLAVINMILNKDGQANLVCLDSLENHALWSEEMNVVLCNPPFGSRTIEKRADVLTHYDLGHQWKYDKDTKNWARSSEVVSSQQLGLLFLERCYKMLTPNGRLAIIVPEGYLCTPSYGYVRKWLLERFQILALVELPRRIFLKSDADLRSNVLIARKLPSIGVPQEPYAVYTDLVRKVGYKLGTGFSVIPKKDPESGLELRNESNELILDTDFNRVRAGYRKFIEATVDGTRIPTDWLGATLDDIANDSKLDMKPRRLTPKALANLADIKNGNHVRLGDIADVMEDTIDLLSNEVGAAQKRRLVEGMDIRAIEGTVIPQESQRCWSIAERKSRLMYPLGRGDIVVGLVRPERRNIGLLLDDGDDVVGSPDGVAVVRPKDGLQSEYPFSWLFATLRSEACRLQFWTESGGTSYGKLTKDQIREVLIPLPDLEDRLAIATKIDEWAAHMTGAMSGWQSVGSPADRKPIMNSAIFGLEGAEDESEEAIDDDLD
ncbi:MAG: N-6 DNA methylase [Candidatus Nanopelagicaceae bacterium]|nr:N-6 DNA methylase [Candidatus Nanopelagicaceae bacterium]